MGVKIGNKGFTLVELLAVMVILVSIALVAVGGITSSLEKRDIKECREQRELAISAAKIYFSLNGVTSVSVKVLNGLNGGVDYFKNDNKIDKLNENDEITLSNGRYVYNVTEGSCVVPENPKDEKSITIIYDANGGEGAPSSQVKYYGVALTLSSDKPTRNGYTFLGWSTSSIATSEAWKAGDNYSVSPEPEDDVTLYAVWRLNQVRINYNVAGGTVKKSTTTEGGTTYTWNTESDGTVIRNGKVFTQKVDYGSTHNLANYNNSKYLYISRTGYVAQGGAELICMSGCSANKTYNQGVSYSSSDFCDASDGDCTVELKVNWKNAIYTVSFDTNGGFIEDKEYIEETLITKVGETQYTASKSGEYKLEVWGAQGATYVARGGYGGYSVGTVMLTEGTTLYANVGGKGSCGSEGNRCSGGYNGGGTGTGSGGGASHIATVSGELKKLSSNKNSVLIVAGGGGGAYYGGPNTTGQGGDGGGYKGVAGDIWVYGSCAGSGGSQTAGGSGCGYGAGSFGKGGSSSDLWGSAGGGGFYGGGASPGLNDLDEGFSPGGGGSGYIGNSLLTNKYMYCYNCTLSNDINTKTISTTNFSTEPISKYAKEGNGAVKITMLTPSKKVTNGTPYGKLPTSSRESYIFVGWNTKADGTGEMITSDTIVNLSSDITLYAIWKSSTIYLYNAGNTYNDITGGYSMYYSEWGGEGCTVSMKSNGIKFYSYNGASGFVRTNNRIDLSNVNRLKVSISNMSSQYDFTIKVIVSDSKLTSVDVPSALVSNSYEGSAVPSGTSKTITVDVGDVQSGYVYVYLEALGNYTNVSFLVTKIIGE